MSLSRISTPVVAATAAPQARDASASFATGAAAPSLGTEAGVSEVAAPQGTAVGSGWARNQAERAMNRARFCRYKVAWNRAPLTKGDFATRFNTRFGKHRYQRFPRGKITRRMENTIGLAYRELYGEFAEFLKSLTIDINQCTTVPWWMTEKEDGDQEEACAKENVPAEVMLRVLDAMANSDRAEAVDWLYDHIKHEYKVGAEAYAAEVAAEKERAAAAAAAPELAEKAKAAAEAALTSARVALVAALPVPLTLDALRAAISAARAELGEEEVLDVRDVIARLLPAPAPAPDEDDWEADADAIDAPDVVAPIVERYAAYIAAKTALKAAKAALK